jgi:hypothetical protein
VGRVRQMGRPENPSERRSPPLEDPQIVLVSATTAELLGRSETAAAIVQLIPIGERVVEHRGLPSVDL